MLSCVDSLYSFHSLDILCTQTLPEDFKINSKFFPQCLLPFSAMFSFFSPDIAKWKVIASVIEVHTSIIRTFTRRLAETNAHKRLNIQNRKPKWNTNKTGKNDGKITTLTKFVWRLRRLKHNDNTRKLTAEEGKPNNRNNGWKYEHETMKCYVTEK